MQEAVVETSRAYVTAHAVTRYVQRLEGIDLGLDEKLLGSVFVMACHLFAAGMTRAEVNDRILKRPVVEAMMKGARAEVRAGRFVAKIEGFTVVTIMPHKPEPFGPRKFKEPTRRETRRLARQLNTRARRAPV